MVQMHPPSQHELLTIAHQNYRKALTAHAYIKLNNRATSEDLVQETFMKTWGYIVKGGEIETMRAFLYHILNNLIIDEYRKHKTTSLDQLLENNFEPTANDHVTLFNILDGKSALLLILKLPDKYQKVLRMRYVQDLSLEEMSLITGQTKNAIAVQIHRGMEKLRLLHENS